MNTLNVRHKLSSGRFEFLNGAGCGGLGRFSCMNVNMTVTLYAP